MHAPDACVGTRAFELHRFDLAIIDIFLPDISGLKIIAKFRQQAPAVSILAISGFIFRNSMDPVPDYLAMAAQADAAACLRKPFASRHLMVAVQMRLASCASRTGTLDTEIRTVTMTLDSTHFDIASSPPRFYSAVEKLSLIETELMSEILKRVVDDASAAMKHQISEPLTALLL